MSCGRTCEGVVIKIPFLGGAYEGRSSAVSPETCINLFYEKGVSGESLVTAPGSDIFKAVSIASVFDGREVRGGFSYDGKLWFVVGDQLRRWDPANGTFGSISGSLNTTSGRVSIANNGVRTSGNQQVMIVDGSYGYIYDNSTETLTQITDTDFVSAKTVAFIDGYFIFNEDNGSGRFWNTESYDGTSILSTDFQTAEGWPDKILSLLVDNRQIFLFGEESLEVWYNSGDIDNTFQRYQGGFKQVGCAAAFSPQRFDNSIVWLSRNERGHAQVVRLGDGYIPKVISTPEIDYQLSTYNNVSDAFAYVYQYEGHEFYVLTFPGDDKTWCYDASTQQWHMRSHGIKGDNPSAEKYTCHVFHDQKHYFGDSDANIYVLNPDVTTIGGNKVIVERTTVSIADEENRRRIASLQVDMEEGMGSDENIYLSYSKDAGHTFSNEVPKTLGGIGEYSKRLIWRRLGQARNWIFRIRCWPTKRLVFKGMIAKLWGEPHG